MIGQRRATSVMIVGMSGEKGALSRGRSASPFGVVLLLATTLVVGACSTSNPPLAAVTTVATPASTVAATTTTVPPTTVFQPAVPKPSREMAATHLIDAWRAGDRLAAALDATEAAVAAVFAQPYPQGGVQFRGCSVAVAGPSFCDYRILATGSLLELSVVEVSGGWATQAARFLS